MTQVIQCGTTKHSYPRSLEGVRVHEFADTSEFADATKIA